MIRVHCLCEACHQWFVEGDNHARHCEPTPPANTGEALCERCFESYPAEMLDMDYCPDCVNAIHRVMAGDFSAHGF